MSLFEANSAEVLVLSSMILIVVILLATFQGKKSKKKPPPRPIAKRPKPKPDLQMPPGLSAYDKDVLHRLAWLLKSPGSIGRIIGDEESFLRAARLAMAEGLATLDELRTLARHLGFDGYALGREGLSTLKLGSGIEISLADGAMTSGAGEVTLNHPSALKVRLRTGQTTFTPGRKVDVICKGRDGLYRFETTVQAQEGKKLLLDHTSELERVQRRRHRRRMLHLPVQVKVWSRETSTKTLDISIGGAAVRNPRKRFGPGQAVRCVFDFRSGESLSLPATIVRTSKGSSVAHLKFGNLEDGTRHKLFRAIIGAAKAR